MKRPLFVEGLCRAYAERLYPTRVIRSTSVLLVFLALGILRGRAQAQPQATGLPPSPEPAIPAILTAFDRYEVVGMSDAHGEKDVDDFILALIRTPAFSQKVNDIAVECGNSLYQPVLDRYIAGEDVPFTEVRKVWRNTTQPMCDLTAFFEEFFPLVRAINQKLPAGRRLRVLAGDPPIDWDKVKTGHDREASENPNPFPHCEHSVRTSSQQSKRKSKTNRKPCNSTPTRSIRC